MKDGACQAYMTSDYIAQLEEKAKLSLDENAFHKDGTKINYYFTEVH